MKPGRPPTLHQALIRALSESAGEVTFVLADGEVVLPARGLLEDGLRAARTLRERGVEPGSRVGLLGPNRPEWIRWAAGTWLAGGTLVPLPHPIRVIDRPAFGEGVRRFVDAAACAKVVAVPPLAGVVPEDVAIPWNTELSARPLDEDPSVGEADLAVIQFTSGSTSSPKAAALSQRAVVSAVFGLADAIRPVPGEDRKASWLPYFHDYGLFSYLLLPLLVGTDLIAVPTERFARNPALWFGTVSEYRATITGGPPSAWAVALRSAERSAEPPDLSSLRMAYLAAEPIDPGLVARLSAAPDLRLDPLALGSGYGLAEATLTVTCTQPGEGLPMDAVDLTALAGGIAEPAGAGSAKHVVSCGSPIAEVECRIAGANGPRPDRQVGEIEVRGPSLMSGYLGQDAPDPFRDGWLRTGDLGYLADGDLYVTGRIKDLIIVLGQNYPPEDIEWAASRVPGVRAGRSVAFTRPGAETEIVVAVEARGDPEPEDLSRKVREAVAATTGLTPREVLILPPGTIPKTTSGKLRRAAVRESFARMHEGVSAADPGGES